MLQNQKTRNSLPILPWLCTAESCKQVKRHTEAEVLVEVPQLVDYVAARGEVGHARPTDSARVGHDPQHVGLTAVRALLWVNPHTVAHGHVNDVHTVSRTFISPSREKIEVKLQWSRFLINLDVLNFRQR